MQDRLTNGFTDALTRPENARFWSPYGKDVDTAVAALEKLAGSGTLRDNATGVCLKIKEKSHSLKIHKFVVKLINH